jgi:hypothetical protein
LLRTTIRITLNSYLLRSGKHQLWYLLVSHIPQFHPCLANKLSKILLKTSAFKLKTLQTCCRSFIAYHTKVL